MNTNSNERKVRRPVDPAAQSPNPSLDGQTLSMELSPNPPTPDDNIFEKWATFATAVLQEESRLVRHLVNHPTVIGDARETLISGVLCRILPSTYEVGTGWIVDSYGNKSRQMDIVIARRDFPALRFPDGSAQYLVESVLATIEVKSTLVKETLHEALDNCRSVGELKISLDRRSLTEAIGKIEKREGTKIHLGGEGPRAVNPVDGALHALSLRVSNELNLLGRPESYVFGFAGYSEDINSFCSAIGDWQQKQGMPVLAWLPTVIAAKGCVAIRNQVGIVDPDTGKWPLTLARIDPNPLGRLVTLLLQHIQRSIAIAPAENGVRPSVERYLHALVVDTFVGIGAMPP